MTSCENNMSVNIFPKTTKIKFKVAGSAERNKEKSTIIKDVVLTKGIQGNISLSIKFKKSNTIIQVIHINMTDQIPINNSLASFFPSSVLFIIKKTMYLYEK